jgi:hypothetical protein
MMIEEKPGLPHSAPRQDPKPTILAKLKPKTRIVIKKIVLENFKSYYGRHTIGPLNWVTKKKKTSYPKSRTLQL